MECLKEMDELELFYRSSARPCAFLDAHGSRFGIYFLVCVNTEETRWHVLIGLPCDTAKWKAGCSRQQNGCCKLRMVKHEKELLFQKEWLIIDLKLETTNFVPSKHR